MFLGSATNVWHVQGYHDLKTGCIQCHPQGTHTYFGMETTWNDLSTAMILISE